MQQIAGLLKMGKKKKEKRKKKIRHNNGGFIIEGIAYCIFLKSLIHF